MSRLSYIFIVFISIVCNGLMAQNTPQDFGYRHFEIPYAEEIVDVLVYSKIGEEAFKKPLFIFCQGSLAIPLLAYNDSNIFHPTPFSRKLIQENYHLVVIGKPGIIVTAHLDSLSPSREYVSKGSGLPPTTYTAQNFLNFYVERNIKVIDFLLVKPWVDSTCVVVAGHSEGSSIAAKMTARSNKVTHLIYSGGTPYFSRILSQISQDRKKETSSKSMVEDNFSYWRRTIEEPYSTSRAHGWNSYKGTFQFSENASQYLKRARIPVLVSYGTKDTASPFNDLLRLESIYENLNNIDFNAYIGLEHNYFPINTDGSINYEEFGWNKVCKDWLAWIKKTK
ncbi:hypothetical protein [uncultured Croceitalea sp.]|uniref:hypothetical protein n=1 Tax=uncultured Croceitalea sp. TaxID=1798908 RepID=UPI0033061923